MSRRRSTAPERGGRSTGALFGATKKKQPASSNPLPSLLCPVLRRVHSSLPTSAEHFVSRAPGNRAERPSSENVVGGEFYDFFVDFFKFNFTARVYCGFQNTVDPNRIRHLTIVYGPPAENRPLQSRLRSVLCVFFIY